jgi:predicted nucleotidyltransferase
MERFVAACREDERVMAAFLGGSYARGTADAHSDLDLYVITTDGAFDAFCVERAAFIRNLGEPPWTFTEKRRHHWLKPMRLLTQLA